jgi:hypothetical protein
MRLFFTSLFFIGFLSVISSQELTGIWRGKFEQNSFDLGSAAFSSETYKYEVQINNLETNALEGVTYSYLTTVFYGKAALKGIYNPKKKTLTLKETVMLDIKATGRTEPCLMTCYLDYKKIGKLEVLSGSYTSLNARTKTDCGNGTVYLERVKESDFEKEAFLNKKKTPKPTTNKTTDIAKEKKNAKVGTSAAESEEVESSVSNKSKKTEKSLSPSNSSAKKASFKSDDLPKTIKPGAKDYVVKKEKSRAIADSSDKMLKIDEPKVQSITKIEGANKNELAPKPKIIPEPEAEVLTERENKLVTTIYVDSREVILAFYDNGEIDNDIISVYKDNKLVVDKKGLSTEPIRLTLNFDEENTFYELITVAENLGDIPPNTALMVVNYGNHRKEISLSSDEKTNAKIIIRYKP